MKGTKRLDDLESRHYDSKPCKLRKIISDRDVSVSHCGGTNSVNETDVETESVGVFQDLPNLEDLPRTANGNGSGESDHLAHGDEEIRTIMHCSSEIMKIVSGMAVPYDKARAIVSSIVADLNRAFQRFDCPFYILPFGSHVNGLACVTSDLDFYFKLISDNREIPEAQTSSAVPDVQTLLKRTAKMLEKSRLFYYVIKIRNARVPIVKFQHKFTEKECDLSFSGELGVRNTYLIQFYLSMNSNLKPLVLFLKYMLQRYNLLGPGRLTTYMLFWLVVYYMQQRDVLPPVMTVRECVSEPYLVRGWDCRVPNSFARPVPDPFSVLFHVKEFLKFYSSFEFLKHVISPYLACTVPIGDFETLRIPSQAFTSYLWKIENEDDVKFSTDVMNVQDPTEHNYNITKHIGVDRLNQFKTFCYFLYNFFAFDLGVKLKSNLALSDVLPKELPNENAISGDWLQYVCLKLNSQRIPLGHELKSTFEKDGIRYFSDSLEKFMQTKFGLNVEKSYTDNVKLIYRKNDELNATAIPMACLMCTAETTAWKKVIVMGKKNKKEKTYPPVDNSSDSLCSFIVMNTPASRKEVRICIESKATFIGYLKRNLLSSLLQKKDVSNTVK